MSPPGLIWLSSNLHELEAALDGARRRAVPRPPALPLDLQARRHRLRSDDRPVASAARARSPTEFVVGTPSIVGDERLGRRHPQVRARAGRRAPDRVGLHPRHAVDDVLHLDAGRLRDGVRLLPDRQDGAGPQPDRRRDRRPGARARRRDRHARPPVQHRPHGHGRAAAQLRQHDEGAAHAPLGARPRHLAAARDALDRGHRARPRAAGARAADAEPRDLAARDDRRAADGARAAEPEVPARRRSSTRAGGSRSRSGAASRSNT